MKNTLRLVLCAILVVMVIVPMFSFGVSATEYKSFEVKATDTALKIDGVKEIDYEKGTIFTSNYCDKNENVDTHYGTKEKPTFTASFLWDGKGKVYCFVEVIDSDIVVNDALWSAKWWHCDSWQMYYDLDYTMAGQTGTFTFVAEETKKYEKTEPNDYCVKLVNGGYNVEFCFDALDENFKVGDKFGFGLYLNDCINFVDTSSYAKCTWKTGTAIDDETQKYNSPNVAQQDCMVLSAEKIDGQTGTIGEATTAAVTTAEATTAEATTAEVTTAEVTTAAAEATTVAAEVTTVAPSTTTEAKSESSCGSFASCAALAAVIAAAYVTLKKKEN